jgi:putative effector of murein hydrolase
MTKHFDKGTIFVIVVTGLLFIIALFVKGFTHGLLLEAGVLMVSIKLIMMAYKNSISYDELKNELQEIKTLLKEK